MPTHPFHTRHRAHRLHLDRGAHCAHRGRSAPPAAVAAGAALAVLLAGAGSAAGADCETRVAEVDTQLAEAEIPDSLRATLTTFRDQAAEICASGNDAGAIARLQSVEMMLSMQAQSRSRKQAVAEELEAARAQLTADYLQGKWCSGREGGERSLWVFAADGSWRAGPASSNYAPVSQGSLEDFRQRWDEISQREPDRFVAGGQPFVRGQGVCVPTAHRP